MPWVKLDDQFPDHPKVVHAGPAAAWLYVCGLAYCARQLTDGFIPSAQLKRLLPSNTVTKLADRLVEARLWEAAGGGFKVHDYLIYNPTRSQTLALREQRASAGRKGGWQKAGKLPEAGQPSATTPVPVPHPVPHEASSPPVGQPEKTTSLVVPTTARTGITALVPLNGGSPQHALLAVAKIALGFNGQTVKEQSRENAAAGQLWKAGVTPDELRDLIAEWRKRGWKDPSLAGIEKNLGRLRAPYEPGRNSADRDEPRGYEGIREAFADLDPRRAS